MRESRRVKKILYVDDDREDAQILRSYLLEIPGQPYELDWVAAPDAALDAMRQDVHDLYLIDYMLGSETGLDILQQIQELDLRKPVIMVTGMGTTTIDRKALSLGVSEFLTKESLSPDILEHTLRYAVAQKNAENKLLALTESLEKQVADRTGKLQKTVDALEQEISERKKAEQAYRQSEARFRDFTETASDWVWELAPDLTFTFVSDRFYEISGLKPADIIGKHRWDYAQPAGSDQNNDSWRKHRQDLEQHRSFRNFEYAAYGGDGSIHYYQLSGKALFDEEGVFQGYRGTARDITALKDAEQILQAKNRTQELLRKTATAANTASSFEEALHTCLTMINAFTGWPVGHVFMRQQTDAPCGEEDVILVPSGIWHLDSPSQFADFVQATKRITFRAGKGLPGRVLTSGRPEWISNLRQDENFPRANLARELGVSAGFAFPILSGDRVVAVLEFFSREMAPPDEMLLESLAHIGNQLGQVYDRIQAERKLRQAMAEVDRINRNLEREVAARTKELSQKVEDLQRTDSALRLSEARLRNIMENIVEAIVTIDENGKIITFNRSAERMFGYSLEEAIGQNVSILMAFIDAKQHNKYIANYLKTGQGKIISSGFREVEARRKNGEVFPVELAISDMKHADSRIFIGTIRDITERKEAERKLLKAKELAERANRSKSEFLANMSHELRTPLNAIIGFSEILKSQMFGEVSDRYLEYAGHINVSGNHLLSLISDILDITSAEVGQLSLHPEQVSLHDIFDACEAMEKDRARQQQLALTFDIPPDLPDIVADPLRIKQMLLNIVDNAIKFTPSGGSIRVTAHQSGDGEIAFSVTDSGVGIAKDNLTAVLEKFHQVRFGPALAHEGAGLGLALVKTLTELHGGRLNLESEVGQGTTVTIALPLKPPAPIDDA